MNEKITFPRLASMLADRSRRSKRFSEDFLREFFTLISERLEAGESVKVKGLGTFRLSRVEPRRSVDVTTGQPMEISGHSKVVFVPSKELADAVNAPFEAFSAIEISDDADISTLLAMEETERPESVPIDFNEDKTDSESELELDSEETVTDPIDDVAPYHVNRFSDSNSEASYQSDGSWISDGSEGSEISNGSDDAEDSEAAGYPEGKWAKKTWRRTLLVSLGAALVVLIAILAVWYVYLNDDFNRILDRAASATIRRRVLPDSESQVAVSTAPYSIPIASDPSDSASGSDSLETIPEEVPTEPSDAIVYDTIGTTRYLTTMARSHYGNFNFWPYIYEENKAKLGHPDRISPGTPVVIPRLSKYGVDPSKPEDIERAKKMGMEIYARYGKKI